MELFFSFIKSILQENKMVLPEWKDIDWQSFYKFAEKQTVLGIVFEGISKYGEELISDIPLDVLYQWIADAEQIKSLNGIVNKKCIEVTQYFADKGFKSCILKGQGNAVMYPNPYSRNAGDIDIWVDCEKTEIVHMVRSAFPDTKESSLHIEFPLFREVSVEVHFFPSYSYVKRYDKKWMQFVREHAEELFSNKILLPGCDGTIAVPTVDFNIIFQVSHMMKHFFKEGIGLRHIIDYYYLLIQAAGKINREETMILLKQMGMLNFARGLMWIEKECLGLKNEFLIAEPDQKRGKLILDEVLAGGNFGSSDKRKAKMLVKMSTTLSIMMRNLKLIRLFPEEAIAAPIDGVIRQYFLSK